MRTFLALIMLAAFSGSGIAAEPSAPTKPTPPPASTPAPKPAEPAKTDDKLPDAAAAAKAAAEKDAKKPADQKASPQRFVPSEQVRADFDVSFPIDI